MQMKALSLKQPWAYAVVHLGKGYENRDWKPSNPNRKFRGICLIHASRSDTRADRDDYEHMMWLGGHHRGLVDRAKLLAVPKYDDLPRGGIVGIANVIDSVTDNSIDLRPKNPQRHWYFGPFALILNHMKPLPFTPCLGALGFFNLDTATLGLDDAILGAYRQEVFGYVNA